MIKRIQSPYLIRLMVYLLYMVLVLVSLDTYFCLYIKSGMFNNKVYPNPIILIRSDNLIRDMEKQSLF